MPHYYFNVRDEYGTYADPKGSILPDIRAARAEAVRVAGKLSANVPKFGSDAVIIVTDVTGEIVLSVPFKTRVWRRITSQCLS
jgi:hypothetical protein